MQAYSAKTDSRRPATPGWRLNKRCNEKQKQLQNIYFIATFILFYFACANGFKEHLGEVLRH